MSVTVITTLAVLLPPVLVPVTTYVATGSAAVGVPFISPVWSLITKPSGKAGEMVYVVISPPVVVGVRVVIPVPTEYVFGVVYERVAGTTSFTFISSVAVAVPPVLVDVTVKLVFGVTIVGVPLIIPVVALIANPFGKTGETL